jgi:hypothetical protein
MLFSLRCARVTLALAQQQTPTSYRLLLNIHLKPELLSRHYADSDTDSQLWFVAIIVV